MTIHKNDLRNLTSAVLKQVGLHSDNAVELLMGTFAQETHLGQLGLVQRGGGPGRGIAQSEPETERWLWEFAARRPGLYEKIIVTSGVFGPSDLHSVGSLIYQIIMTRLKYLSCPGALPDAGDVLGMAEYWKKYYNTELGKGTVNEFVANYNRFIK